MSETNDGPHERPAWMNGMAKDPRLSEIEALLEVYGADRSRWPAARRLALASFIAHDDEARRMIGEARALDRLIEDAEPSDKAAGYALTERILALAAAEGLGRPETPPETTSRQDAAAPRPAHDRPASSATARRSVIRQFVALAAAVLLLFGSGVYAGSTGLFSASGDRMADADLFTDPADPLFDEDII